MVMDGNEAFGGEHSVGYSEVEMQCTHEINIVL